MSKRIVIISVCVVLLLFGGITWGSLYLLNVALKPECADTHNLPMRLQSVEHDMPWIRPWVDSLQRARALKDTFLLMDHKERHHATYIHSHTPSNRVAVLVHGYTDNGMAMMGIASIYGRRNYNIVLPDLHAHGRSDGEYVQMGWKDRKDVAQWIKWAQSMFADSTGQVQVVVHGVSMGAATTMCVSGMDLPASVKCFVEDCGYTSVWDEYRHELKEEYGLPAFPLLYTASWYCSLLHGWDFREASPLRMVARCHKPMLFIHGNRDTYVPTWMVYQLYKAKPQPKELWITKGVTHARSYTDRHQEYERKIAHFIGKYIN